jgi:hypothetical protein
MTAAVGMMPEKKFGVVVLSNMGQAQLPEILRRYIFDRQLGAPMKDLSGETYAQYQTQRRRADSAAAQQAKQHPASALPPLPAHRLRRNVHGQPLRRRRCERQ